MDKEYILHTYFNGKILGIKKTKESELTENEKAHILPQNTKEIDGIIHVNLYPIPKYGE